MFYPEIALKKYPVETVKHSTVVVRWERGFYTYFKRIDLDLSGIHLSFFTHTADARQKTANFKPSNFKLQIFIM
jgi:hypothetical protein